MNDWNNTESVRAFAYWLANREFSNAEARRKVLDLADNFCAAQGFPNGRQVYSLTHEVKPVPCA